MLYRNRSRYHMMNNHLFRLKNRLKNLAPYDG